MKNLFLTILAGLAITTVCNAQQTFKVKVDQPAHGRVTVNPEIPEDGVVEAGTVLNVKVEVTDEGWVFDSGYYLSISKGMFYPTYKESMTPEFQVKVEENIMSLGGSIIEDWRHDGHKVVSDVVYAQPGVKPLKYDVYIPDGAKNLPGIIIIHGGGWNSNNEDIMRGLARELIKGGKYVVASIDYRWIANMDGDETPNQMHQLIEDCYGAVLHIQEHAAEYGMDPSRLALTGDSAGGHLSSSLSNMVEKVGEAGFGVKEGVYEFLPTYMPEGMDAQQAQKSLHAIKAVAPSYGVFDCGSLKFYVRSLPEKFRAAVAPMENIPSATVREVPQYLVLGTEDRTVSREQMEIYVEKLKNAGHKAELVIVENAAHAFFDWKPDQETKDIFAQYGVPYAADMLRFFDEVFYR